MSLLCRYLYVSAASGQRIYLEAGLQFFNLLWTALPIVVCAIYDRDVSDDLARKVREPSTQQPPAPAGAAPPAPAAPSAAPTQMPTQMPMRARAG